MRSHLTTLGNAKVMLRTGQLEDRSLCEATFLALAALLYADRLALYEVVQRCKNPRHRNFFISNERLKPFIDDNGQIINKSVRNIVLACIEESGMELKPVDPLGNWSM